jgi:hypothetical protein
MSTGNSVSSIFSSCPIASSPVSGCLRRQLCHPPQIIPSSYPPRRQLRLLDSPKTRFPEPSRRLHSTKDLFDSLSYPLAYTIARIPSGTAIDGRCSSSLDVNLGPSQVGIHPIKNPRQTQKFLISILFNISYWMVSWNSVLRRYQRRHTCLPVFRLARRYLRYDFTHLKASSDLQRRQKFRKQEFSAAS